MQLAVGKTYIVQAKLYEGFSVIAASEAKDDLAMRTLEELSSFGLTAVPEHYVTWYRHLEGRDRAMSEEVENRRALNHPITSLFLLGLFDQYCYSESKQDDNLKSAMKSLETDSSGLLELANEISGTAGDFGAEINSAISSLSDEKASDADLRSTIDVLMETSAKAEKKSNTLKQEIGTVTENITATKSFIEQIEEQADSDALTKLTNRRRFNRLLEDNIVLAVEDRAPLSLVMCSVDGFKRFNLAYGYQAGDQALVHLANFLQRNIKGGDILARIHGDEFAVALPKTSLDGAVAVAETLRTAIEACKFTSRSTGGSLGQLTMSFGVAEFQSGMTYDALIDDGCVYLQESKALGGNSVFSSRELKAEKSA